MVKELGQVHKRVGALVIERVGGLHTGVGAGAGERIRPSADTRAVLLRVGGSHRSARKLQWGIRQVWPGGDAPHRPYLIGGAEASTDQITDEYLAGLNRVAAPLRIERR